MKSFIFIFFNFFFIGISTIGQEYNYYHYDVRDGLSGITIYSIAQDRDGFLWVGTETGLSRFDGSRFKNYTENEGLNENEIINLFVDSKNRVWIFPFKNSIYYYYNGKIFNASNDSLLKKFNLRNEIYKACEDKNGNIFFLETNKLHILSANNKLTEINEFNGKSFYNYGCGVAADGTCNLYIGTPQDIANSRIQNFEFRNFEFLAKRTSQYQHLSRNAFEVNASFILVKNAGFIEIYNQNTKEQFKVEVPDHFHSISYINDSCFIISTFEKTLLFNIKQKKFIDSFLTNKLVNRCLRDSEGNLWFATMTQGLYRLSSTKFKVYKVEDNFSLMPVYALDRVDKHLYIGSGKNLLWDLNLQNDQLKKSIIKSDYTINRLSAIQSHDKQTLFLATNAGLFKTSKTNTSIYFPDVSLKGCLINKDSAIVATDRAVFEFSLRDINHYDTIWNSRATCAYKIDNKYYIGTLNGLYLVRKYPEHSITYLGDVFPILKEKIIAISAETSGNLWIATESHGLICLKNDSIIYQLTTKSGLVSNVCRCVYVADSVIWLGTNKGISKIDFSKNPFNVTNFRTAEGLDSEIINCIYSKDDTVFAGTPFGVTSFIANNIQNKSICELKLIDIQSKKHNWYYKQDSIYLSSNDNFLRFEYSGISFVSAGDMTYYYRLTGLNNTWQSTKQNFVEFQLLPAGDYEFDIYAVNKYGIKSEVVTVSFIKKKTFWQLVWVRSLLIAFVILVGWFILRLVIKRIKIKANDKMVRERKIYELEQMAMRAQMNPHFIFNSLNSIQQYVFAGDITEANEFITNFSSLVRQTLYISGKKFITLIEEVTYLESYLKLEQAKYENVFDFQIKVNDDIPKNMHVPPLLLQPFIENSIRHGVLNLKKGYGKIFVHFSMNSHFLICIIEDNGIGRENAMKLKNTAASGHQSKGIELVKKRIENLNTIYNTDIKVSVGDILEKNKTGTCVQIQLPLVYEEN